MTIKPSPFPWKLRFNPDFKFIELVAADGNVVWSFDPESHGPVEDANARVCRAAAASIMALRGIDELLSGRDMSGAAPREIYLVGKIREQIKLAADAMSQPIEYPAEAGDEVG